MFEYKFNRRFFLLLLNSFLLIAIEKVFGKQNEIYSKIRKFIIAEKEIYTYDDFLLFDDEIHRSN